VPAAGRDGTSWANDTVEGQQALAALRPLRCSIDAIKTILGDDVQMLFDNTTFVGGNHSVRRRLLQCATCTCA
jgi:hypothetical protein